MNFIQFLATQQLEDRQAIVVHGPALSGKTKFVNQLINLNENIFLIDFLSSYIQNPDPPIHLMGFSAFKEYLLSLEIPDKYKIVVIDQLDFLFNTWDRSEKEKFIQWLRTGLRSPSVVKQVYVFFIQTDDIINKSKLINSLGQNRIIGLEALENIQYTGSN